MTFPLEIALPVRQALGNDDPVVALESTVIAHGLPAPRNRKVALACEEAVRDRGATPATIAILDGRVIIGCTEEQIDELAAAKDVAKVSRRDLAAVVAGERNGATTVAGTMVCAAEAGIPVMATGGIGGVHRGGETSLDISADLEELARTPVAVVCSGAKSILDIARTLEFLETKGVPVAGFATDAFPAFFSRDSGLTVPLRVDSPRDAARLTATHMALPRGGGLVIANPVPAEKAIDPHLVDTWLRTGLQEAADRGISGRDVTPFLLSSLVKLSGGKTLEANASLLVENARLAAAIAVEMKGL